MGIAQASIPGRQHASRTRHPEALVTPIPTGRNRVGDEHDGDVRAAEKQRIMASAALSPVAPSSFLVRALCSEGEGTSDNPLARLRPAAHVCREGAAAGGFSSPEGDSRDWRRDARARQIGREGVRVGKSKPEERGREGAPGGARPWDHAARRGETGRPGRCSARVPSRLARSLPALRALRPSAAPGKPAVLTALRAGRAGEVRRRRLFPGSLRSLPRRARAVQTAERRVGARASPQQRSPGPSRESSQAHGPAMAGPPRGGRVTWVLPSLPSRMSVCGSDLWLARPPCGCTLYYLFLG